MTIYNSGAARAREKHAKKETCTYYVVEWYFEDDSARVVARTAYLGTKRAFFQNNGYVDRFVFHRDYAFTPEDALRIAKHGLDREIKAKERSIRDMRVRLASLDKPRYVDATEAAIAARQAAAKAKKGG